MGVRLTIVLFTHRAYDPSERPQSPIFNTTQLLQLVIRQFVRIKRRVALLAQVKDFALQCILNFAHPPSGR